MATQMQEAAADMLVEQARKSGGKISVSRAMRESPKPYSSKTAKNPKKLTESKGFQEICLEKGLTQGFLVKALVADIKAKPKNRKAELELGFKVAGLLNDKEEDKSTAPRTVNIIFFDGGNNNKHPEYREAKVSIPGIVQSEG